MHQSVVWNTDRSDVEGGYLRKYFRKNKTLTNTAKKVGLYFILFSAFNVLYYATKYFVLLFRNYIIRFRNRKKMFEICSEKFLFCCKNLGRFKKDFNKKIVK